MLFDDEYQRQQGFQDASVAAILGLIDRLDDRVDLVVWKNMLGLRTVHLRSLRRRPDGRPARGQAIECRILVFSLRIQSCRRPSVPGPASRRSCGCRRDRVPARAQKCLQRQRTAERHRLVGVRGRFRHRSVTSDTKPGTRSRSSATGPGFSGRGSVSVPHGSAANIPTDRRPPVRPKAVLTQARGRRRIVSLCSNTV